LIKEDVPLSKIVAKVTGSGRWEPGMGEADFLKSCAECEGEVKIFKITPHMNGVDFFLEAVFSVAGSMCAITDEVIAEWRVRYDILQSVFSKYWIKKETYEKQS
jgi:hypothetical protein